MNLEKLLFVAVQSVSKKEMKRNKKLNQQTKKILELLHKFKKQKSMGDKNANSKT